MPRYTPSSFAPAILAALLALGAAAQPPAPAAVEPDYPGEAFVVEQLTTEVAFQADGTGQEETAMRVRIQSSAGVQRFGVLTLPYRGANQRVEIVQIRVRKPDGGEVSTPDSSVQDLPTAVTRLAPTYSDLREKQIPVKALGVGDVLEYRVRKVTTKAEIPGEFWYAHNFTKDGPVLEETLRVTVPAGRPLKLASPGNEPEVSDKDGLKTYVWKTSHRPPRDRKPAFKGNAIRKRPSVQLSTFQSWEDVGRWYAALQKPKVEPTPEIRAKAAELTEGISTNAGKLRAIYEFVSTKFHYISVSFGSGRYEPHSAGEVLANQYGDCKDKHTLLAALLAAAGIEAWPALIGAGIEFDPAVPSPGQFNHVITYVPSGDSPTWLDTTPEVAPYGMLLSLLRGRQALLVPGSGDPRLATTPESTPAPTEEVSQMKAHLASDGTLTGRFDLALGDDTGVLLKLAFRSIGPAQWATLAQYVSKSVGMDGTVSDVDLAQLNETEAPLHISYEYARKDYSDWNNRLIIAPLPIAALPKAADAGQPSEPVELGVADKFVYRAALELPSGFSARAPEGASLREEFAEYTSTYSVDKGVISAERVIHFKKQKIAPSDWDAYVSFSRAVVKDESRYFRIVLAGADVPAGAPPASAHNDPRSAELIKQAIEAADRSEFQKAQELLAQAEQADKRRPGLWAAYAYLYGRQNRNDKAIEALRKELEVTPSSDTAYPYLISLLHDAGRLDEEIDARRRQIQATPGNLTALNGLVSLLIRNKRYLEAVDPLTAAIGRNPGNTSLRMNLFHVLLYGGKKDDAMAMLAKMRGSGLTASQSNNAGYLLVNAGVEVALGKEMVEKSVADLEGALKNVTLASLTDADLKNVAELGAAWDSVGWAAFRLGDIERARKFVYADWMLVQHATAAHHLGQIYQRQGQTDQAIHAYQLALAINPNLLDARERLVALSAEAPARAGPDRPPSRLMTSLEEEVSKMRTKPVPGLPQAKGTADFFVLFSAKGIEDLQFASGDETLKPAASLLRKIPYEPVLPDGGAARIPRRGILSCSANTTPNCNFTLLPPAAATR